MAQLYNQKNATEALQYFWSMQGREIKRSDLEKSMVRELYFALGFASSISPEDIRKYNMPMSLLKSENDSILQARELLLTASNQEIARGQIRSASDILSAYCTSMQKGLFCSAENYAFALSSVLKNKIRA